MIFQGITSFICGTDGLDSSGLSSSAAVSFCFFARLLLFVGRFKLWAQNWANLLIGIEGSFTVLTRFRT